MDEENKNLKDLQALGETLAALPEFQGWKQEAARQLRAGEAEDSVLVWLVEQVCTVLDEGEQAAGFDRIVASWLCEWAKAGQPGPMFKEVLGSVVWYPLPDGTPLVIAVAGPLSDPEELAAEFLGVCRDVLPAETWVRKANPERDARWFRWFKEGLTDREIAERHLEEDGFRLRAVDDTEWKTEVTAWANRVAVARIRWWQHVTRKAGLV